MANVTAIVRRTNVFLSQPRFSIKVRPAATININNGGGGGGVSSYNDLDDVPTEFPPSAHTHIIANVTGLQGALDGKASTAHAHAISDVTGLQGELDGKAPTAHTHTIANVTGLQGALDAKQGALGFIPENSADKGVAGGYASLDGTGKVPAIQLPSYVDDVIEASNFAALPGTGETGKIYVTLDDNKSFRWSGSAYAEISASPGSTDAVTEGATNKYFTTARVLAAALTGFAASGTRTAVVATDTILQALGKVQKYLSDLATVAFSGSASDLTAGTLPAARFDDTAHGIRSGGALHAAASGAAAGFMTAADKTKLDAITGINTGDQTIALTGDVAGSGTGSFAATIAADAVTNAKLANMPATTLKGNSTGGAADPADLTGTQATALLDVFTSGAKGLAPASGGGTSNFLRADGTWAVPGSSMIQSIIIAASDETTPLTTGNGKVTFRMPYAFTLTAVRASLTAAQVSGSIFTADINENGVSILSTPLTIDNTEKTSTTAATPAVISDTALADDAEITIDIDQVGSGSAAGLKVALIGYKT